MERSFRVPAGLARAQAASCTSRPWPGTPWCSSTGKARSRTTSTCSCPSRPTSPTASMFGGANVVRVGVRKASLFNDTRTTGSRPYPAGSFWGQAIVGHLAGRLFRVAVPAVRAQETYVEAGSLARRALRRSHSPQRHGARPDGAGRRVGAALGEPRPGEDVLTGPEPRWHLGATVLSLPPRSVTLPPGRRRRSRSVRVSAGGCACGRRTRRTCTA